MRNKLLLEASNISKVYNSSSTSSGKSFTALSNISFKIHEGENLAIVGKNGSGKSTLLKILSNVTTPTTGQVKLYGKPASLLELGTGFHPDLSGLKNIYFYGSILGFKKNEIKQSLDSIVDFSGIEDFLHAPVRNYSSGMKMRLAFSVATFLKSDILLVDEVLAVGDSDFRNKCIKKIQEEREKGRALIFVSHNMGLVTSLCPKSILLQNGNLVKFGNSKEVVDHYFSNNYNLHPQVSFDITDDQEVSLISGRVCNQHGNTAEKFDLKDKISLEMVLQINTTAITQFIAGFHVYTNDGLLLFPANYSFNHTSQNSSKNLVKIICEIQDNLLNTGLHFVSLACSSWVNTSQRFFLKEEVLSFEVTEVISERKVDYFGEYPGAIRVDLKFDHELV